MKVVLEILKFIDIITLAYLVYYIITGLYTLKSKPKISVGNKKHNFAGRLGKNSILYIQIFQIT